MDKLKFLFKWSERVISYTFAFWILETVAFLIIEGWHTKATNPIEITLDKIVSWGLILWVVLFVSALSELLRLVVTSVKEVKDGQDNND